MREPALEAALRRDRWIVVAALLAITTLALGYTAWLATAFDMSAMMSPEYASWTIKYFAFMAAMWIVMMIGMMTPSVAPMVLLYAALARRQPSTPGDGRPAFAPAGWFFSGYLLAWTVFAVGATLLQWWLESRALVTPMMAGTSRRIAGVVLIVAGVYQWLPFKQACLSSCHSPLSFVQRHGGFQPGGSASLRLGVLHGFYCIGCCWVLMALLFAFGVMNLTWIAGLMIFVLLEKLLPWPRAVSRGAGVVAIAGGAWLIA
jgi:predicted metal-binding membrane protein